MRKELQDCLSSLQDSEWDELRYWADRYCPSLEGSWRCRLNENVLDHPIACSLIVDDNFITVAFYKSKRIVYFYTVDGKQSVPMEIDPILLASSFSYNDLSQDILDTVKKISGNAVDNPINVNKHIKDHPGVIIKTNEKNVDVIHSITLSPSHGNTAFSESVAILCEEGWSFSDVCFKNRAFYKNIFNNCNFTNTIFENCTITNCCFCGTLDNFCPIGTDICGNVFSIMEKSIVCHAEADKSKFNDNIVLTEQSDTLFKTGLLSSIKGNAIAVAWNKVIRSAHFNKTIKCWVF